MTSCDIQEVKEMNTANSLQQQTNEHLEHWADLWFSEHKRAGYVAITDFKKQLFFGAKDVKKVIRSTAGRKKQFISINAFQVDWNNKEYSRRTSNLKQIRNIAIDIDQYKLDITIEQALDELQAMILEKQIPEPNLVLVSRGIQLFYSISHGASPEMTWLASFITEQLISKLKHVGADSNAKDMSRVMRVPNSINERNNAVVKPYIWNDETYSLQQLQAYCRPLEKFEYQGKKKKNIINLPINSKIAMYYKTNHARLRDLRKLIKLRNGNFTHMRNTFIYIYSYFQSLTLNTQKEVIEDVSEVFEQLYTTDKKAEKITKRQLENTIKSAYKNAKEFFEYYTKNGFKIDYNTGASDGIKRPYRTETIIKLLDINEKEQYHLGSIRNEEVAKKQHADYMRNKRLQDGTHKQTREQYNNSRQQQKQAKINELKQLLADNPKLSNVKLGKIMNVSEGYIRKLKLEL